MDYIMQALVFHFPFASSEVETPIRRVLPMGISTSLDANGCGE
jgi:hypothetical protein